MTTSRFHLVMINYAYGGDAATANQWLDQAGPLTHWAEEVQAAGAKVTVFQRFSHNDVVHRAQVTYHLIRDHFASELNAWQIPRQLHWSARVLCMASINAGYATLVHINGLRFPLQTWRLRALLPATCAIAMQHQGEQPWPMSQRFVQRWAIKQVDGFIFTDPAAAARWTQAQILWAHQRSYTLSQEHSLLSQANPSRGPQILEIYREILWRRTKENGAT